jgi:hypothetical protein
MSVSILAGQWDGDEDRAVATLYCNSTNWAFGPVMRPEDAAAFTWSISTVEEALAHAEAFLSHVRRNHGDPRTLDDNGLLRLYLEFCETHVPD